ncbi:MAG: hypothetical protein R3B96_12885 [Pirellulaceae bacterium]
MAQRDSGWPLYLSTAFICILGLWALYLWQLHLDRQWGEALAHRRTEAMVQPSPFSQRNVDLQVAPPVRVSELEVAASPTVTPTEPTVQPSTRDSVTPAIRSIVNHFLPISSSAGRPFPSPSAGQLTDLDAFGVEANTKTQPPPNSRSANRTTRFPHPS